MLVSMHASLLLLFVNQLKSCDWTANRVCAIDYMTEDRYAAFYAGLIIFSSHLSRNIIIV